MNQQVILLVKSCLAYYLKMTVEIEFIAYLPTTAITIKKIAGTIQEVLTQLSQMKLRMSHVVETSWVDDGTNLEVVTIQTT